MVAISTALVSLCLAASTLAVPHQHEKRLFGLSWGSPTTSSSSSSSTTSSSTSSSTTSSSTSSSSTKVSTTSTSAALATGTNTPSGNIAVFSNQDFIVTSLDKISSSTMTSLSAQSCQQMCAAQSGCVFYNIYTAANFFTAWFGSTPYCALYSQQHSLADINDNGFFYGMTYDNSYGYIMAASPAQVTIATTAVAPTATLTAAYVSSSSTSSSSVFSSTKVTSSSTSVLPTSSSSASTSSSKAASTTSSSSSSSASSTTSTSAGLLPNLLAVAATTSSAAPATSSSAKSSSTTAAAINGLLGQTLLASSSSSLLATSIPTLATTSRVATSSTAATGLLGNVVNQVTSALAVPTTIASTVSSSSPSASASSAAACGLPSWAFPAWCQTGTNVIGNILASVLNPLLIPKGYIIPLYIYPSWWLSPGAWDWVYNAAVAYPGVDFVVIINPSSGPGTGAAPNSDYQHEIIRLAAVSNIKMLGYVDTAYGSRAAADVANDVSHYAGWASTDSRLAMDGIFFDNQAAGANYLSQYSSYASQVKTNSTFLSGLVGFAPGAICNPGYIDLADFVVVFEQASSIVQADLSGWYQSFVAGLSSAQLSKLTFMVNSVDSTTKQVLPNLQSALLSKYLYFTDNTGSSGSAFQSAPSSTTLSSILSQISNPLSGIPTLLSGLGL